MIYDGIQDFRTRLAAGQVLLGTTVSLADPQVTEALADSVDFLWLDQEHSPVGIEVVRAHLIAARGRRCALLVRVAGSDTAHIKPILDAGAGGIVVPQVRTVDEVRGVIADCRYPPAGRRGFGPVAAADYGRQADGYVSRADASVFVSVMIECVEAVESIDDIVALPGLDGICLGPYDLSGSLGLLGQVGHPEVVAAMARVIDAGRRRGLPVGSGMPADVDFARAQIERGVQWLQMGGDLGYARQALDATVDAVRAGLPPRS